MSVTIRTFDNLFIRIPTQKVFESEVTNVTRYPIRRLDLKFWVNPGENLESVKKVLAETARRNPAALVQPDPLIVITGIEDNGIGILLGVWFYKSDYLEVKNSITIEVLENLEKHGIKLSFSRKIVEMGDYTNPSASASDSSSS